MKVQVSIQQLLMFVRTLTTAQRARLRKVLTDKAEPVSKRSRLTELLLNGPVLADDEINIIKETRKSINKWRTEY